MPLISICIVAYNLEKYIGECIESALRQEMDNYEIVVVDNGSSDKTIEICQEYAEKYPNKIRFKKLPLPTKPVRGHIEAVKMARGEYIHLIDGDDCVAENYLTGIKQLLEEKKPELVLGTFKCIIEEGAFNYMDVSIDADKINTVSTKEAVEYILSLPYFNRYVWRFIVKRELFALVDFDESTKYLVGVDGLKSTLWLLNCKSISFYQGDFYYYRRRMGSTVLSKNNLLTKDYIKLLFATLIQLEKIEPEERRNWAIRLEEPQLLWYLKLFLAGSDYLEAEDFKEISEWVKGQKLNDKVCYAEFAPTLFRELLENEVMKNLQQYVQYNVKTLLDALQEDKQTEVYIFPTGTFSFHTQRILENAGYSVLGFLDNDEKKNGNRINGLPCHTLTAFAAQKNITERSKYRYVISSIYEDLIGEFEQQLLSLGIKKEQIVVKK